MAALAATNPPTTIGARDAALAAEINERYTNSAYLSDRLVTETFASDR